MNRKNLKTLSDGLLGLIPPKVSVEKIGFDMDIFSMGGSYRNLYCDTAGCAIGWAPFFGIKKKMVEPFINYSHRVFDVTGDEWAWLFANSWSDVDNTKEGAGLRIKHFLEHGLPDDWNDQMYERAPLSYLNNNQDGK